MKRVWKIACTVLWVAWLSACAKSETPTAIRVIIDSDLEIGSELTRLDVHIVDPKGQDEWRTQSFALGDSKGPAQFTLPMSFRLAPEKQSSTYDFLLVVTGIGPLGEGGSEIEVVEQQALASFRPDETLRLDMYLARRCLLELCRKDGERSALSCDVQTGSCTEVPERNELPAATGDGIAGYEQAKLDAAVEQGGSEGEPVDGGELPPSGPGISPGMGTLGATCGSEGTKACAGHNSTDALLCSKGSWILRVACDSNQRCDTREGATRGTCQTIVTPCLGRPPREVACEDAGLLTCGDDLLDFEHHSCGQDQHCVEEKQPSCACDDGFESDGAGGCKNIDDCIRNGAPPILWTRSLCCVS